MQDDHYAIINKSVFTRALKQIQKNYICNLGQHITIAPNEARLVIPKQSTDHCLPFPHCKYHSSQRCAFEGSIWLASLSIAVFYCRRQGARFCRAKGLVTDCRGRQIQSTWAKGSNEP